jgi:hypothetical protein
MRVQCGFGSKHCRWRSYSRPTASAMLYSVRIQCLSQLLFNGAYFPSCKWHFCLKFCKLYEANTCLALPLLTLKNSCRSSTWQSPCFRSRLFFDRATLQGEKRYVDLNLQSASWLIVLTSVAEPEPVEQQLFAGAGAGAKVFFCPAPAPKPGM